MKKTTRKRARSLQQVLATTDGFSELAARVQAMVDVQSALQSGWPSLPLQVVSIRAGVLTLRAASSALAAKARQSEPSILTAARQAYAPIESVRIKAAKTVTAPPAPRQSASNPISELTLNRLEHTTDTLSPGPVRDALARMKTRRRQRR